MESREGNKENTGTESPDIIIVREIGERNGVNTGERAEEYRSEEQCNRLSESI